MTRTWDWPANIWVNGDGKNEVLLFSDCHESSVCWKAVIWSLPVQISERIFPKLFDISSVDLMDTWMKIWILETWSHTQPCEFELDLMNLGRCEYVDSVSKSYELTSSGEDRQGTFPKCDVESVGKILTMRLTNQLAGISTSPVSLPFWSGFIHVWACAW
jgi:hypothetical protein